MTKQYIDYMPKRIEQANMEYFNQDRKSSLQLGLFKRSGVKNWKIRYISMNWTAIRMRQKNRKEVRVRKERYFDLEGTSIRSSKKLLEDFVWERERNFLQVVWRPKYYILIISGIFL